MVKNHYNCHTVSCWIIVPRPVLSYTLLQRNVSYMTGAYTKRWKDDHVTETGEKQLLASTLSVVGWHQNAVEWTSKYMYKGRWRYSGPQMHSWSSFDKYWDVQQGDVQISSRQKEGMFICTSDECSSLFFCQCVGQWGQRMVNIQIKKTKASSKS